MPPPDDSSRDIVEPDVAGIASAAPLQSQIAVVTGATGGIGKAVAGELAAHGVTVCAVGRKLDELEALAQEAASSAGEVRAYRADLTEDGDIYRLRDRITSEFGDIDVLVHSAGVISMGPLASAPVAELDYQYRTNVRGPYLLTQAFLPSLMARKGQIVFVNSSAGLRPSANAGQYAATKHALKAIADSLRDEVNPSGVRVLSIYPGRTASEMQAGIHRVEQKPYVAERLLQPKDIADVVVCALRLPRSAEVTDINIRPAVKPP